MELNGMFKKLSKIFLSFALVGSVISTYGKAGEVKAENVDYSLYIDIDNKEIRKNNASGEDLTESLKENLYFEEDKLVFDNFVFTSSAVKTVIVSNSVTVVLRGTSTITNNTYLPEYKEVTTFYSDSSIVIEGNGTLNIANEMTYNKDDSSFNQDKSIFAMRVWNLKMESGSLNINLNDVPNKGYALYLISDSLVVGEDASINAVADADITPNDSVVKKCWGIKASQIMNSGTIYAQGLYDVEVPNGVKNVTDTAIFESYSEQTTKLKLPSYLNLDCALETVFVGGENRGDTDALKCNSNGCTYANDSSKIPSYVKYLNNKMLVQSIGFEEENGILLELAGEEKQLFLKGFPYAPDDSDYAKNDYIISSSDESVVKIVDNKSVKAVGNGTATLTVSTIYENAENVSGTIDVVVNIIEGVTNDSYMILPAEIFGYSPGIYDSTMSSVTVSKMNFVDSKLVLNNFEMFTANEDGALTLYGATTFNITGTNQIKVLESKVDMPAIYAVDLSTDGPANVIIEGDGSLFVNGFMGTLTLGENVNFESYSKNQSYMGLEIVLSANDERTIRGGENLGDTEELTYNAEYGYYVLKNDPNVVAMYIVIGEPTGNPEPTPTYTITLDRTNYADGNVTLSTYNSDNSKASETTTNNASLLLPDNGSVGVLADCEFTVEVIVPEGSEAPKVSEMTSDDTGYSYTITEFTSDATIVVNLKQNDDESDTTVTEALDFNDKDTSSGQGWNWDSVNKVLELDGFNQEISTKDYAIELPDGSTIKLINNSTNVIKSPLTGISGSNITIEGSGSLTIEAEDYGILAGGLVPGIKVNGNVELNTSNIGCEGSIYINNGTVKVNSIVGFALVVGENGVVEVESKVEIYNIGSNLPETGEANAISANYVIGANESYESGITQVLTKHDDATVMMISGKEISNPNEKPGDDDTTEDGDNTATGGDLPGKDPVDPEKPDDNTATDGDLSGKDPVIVYPVRPSKPTTAVGKLNSTTSKVETIINSGTVEEVNKVIEATLATDYLNFEIINNGVQYSVTDAENYDVRINNINTVITSLLTDEEIVQAASGKLNASILLNTEVVIVEDIADTTKTKIIDVTPVGYQLKETVDISLFKVLGSEKTQIKETSAGIEVTMELPESIRNEKDVKIIRVHNEGTPEEEATVLTSVVNGDGTITFITDKFSTYAFVTSDMDLSAYSNFGLEVYHNSRVISLENTKNGFDVFGYMWIDYVTPTKNTWREIIFVNTEDASTEKAYRMNTNAVYNTFLNPNMYATRDGKVDLSYACYKANVNTNSISSYDKKSTGKMASGTYYAFMRISDGKDSYLFPLVDRVLSDGSTMVLDGKLPANFSLSDDLSRTIIYTVE